MNDPYLIPGTNVLRNKLDIGDATELARAERMLSAWRMSDLPEIELSVGGYRALHKAIFQDIYEWAGETRKINIAKVMNENTTTSFLPGIYVDVNLQRIFAELCDDNFLKERDRNTFSAQAAVYLADLNRIHAFREGNGRAQRAFLKLLARQAGHELDLRRIQPAAWLSASIRSHAPANTGSLDLSHYRELAAVIDGALPRPR